MADANLRCSEADNRALLALHPEPAAVTRVHCPGSPPPLMASTASALPAVDQSVHVAQAAHSQAPVTMVQITPTSRMKVMVVSGPPGPEGYVNPSTGHVLPLISYFSHPSVIPGHQHQQALSSFVAPIHPTPHPATSSCNMAATSHPWSGTLIKAPTYFPPTMTVASTHGVITTASVSHARVLREGKRRRHSSSDTSGYLTASTESDLNCGAKKRTKQVSSSPMTGSPMYSPVIVGVPQSAEQRYESDSDAYIDVEKDDSDLAKHDVADLDDCGMLDHEIPRFRKDESDLVGKYICNNCCDAFPTLSSLKRHHAEQHEQKRPYTCDECGKAFQHPYSLRVHRRTQHNDLDACRLFQCEHCEKEFASAASLKVHARMHTGERPFECSTCGKTFMRSHQLKMHQRVHLMYKPHVCPICKKNFTQFKYLKEHCQRHAGYLPHQCNTCNKAFLRPSHLKKHMKVHSADHSSGYNPLIGHQQTEA